MKMDLFERYEFVQKQIRKLTTQLCNAGIPEFEIGNVLLREGLGSINSPNQTGQEAREIKDFELHTIEDLKFLREIEEKLKK